MTFSFNKPSGFYSIVLFSLSLQQESQMHVFFISTLTVVVVFK